MRTFACALRSVWCRGEKHDTDLPDNLVGALDEDLYGPPVILCHVVHEPLHDKTINLVTIML